LIAVLGAHGQLGSAFVKALGGDCLPVTRDQLDLTDTGSIATWVESVKPTLVINCAAYTAVDAAESDADTARAVNTVAVGALAEATDRLGVGLVTFSTDYVFYGEKQGGYVESDMTNPLNVYGATKAEGERLALAANPGALVVRTSWLLSTTHHCFLTTILSKLEEGVVSVVDDQRGRPTLVDDLVRSCLDAVDVGATGILHLTNRGDTTWFGLAREIAELAGGDPKMVRATTSRFVAGRARRPLNSILDTERLRALRVNPLPDYRESLVRAMRTIT
jgi:dTDP-4-dehydrorhamnose reductase